MRSLNDLLVELHPPKDYNEVYIGKKPKEFWFWKSFKLNLHEKILT